VLESATAASLTETLEDFKPDVLRLIGHGRWFPADECVKVQLRAEGTAAGDDYITAARLLQVFDDYKIPGVLAINGSALSAYPPIVEAALQRNWEFMGHGFTQRNMQKVENEREDIRKTADAIKAATGKRPRGWLGPGLTETWETPDLLKQEGYDYVADWVLDDQPVWLKTTTTPIVNVPYTQECNDVAMMLIQHHPASEYYNRAIDQFEQIYDDAADSARIMALVIHPYIMGAPHRLKYFRRIFETIRKKSDVAFMTGEQILDWYLSVGPKAP